MRIILRYAPTIAAFVPFAAFMFFINRFSKTHGRAFAAPARPKREMNGT
jgi:hypothetical protein